MFSDVQVSPYARMLRLAEEQVAALGRGDVETAIRLLDDRAEILASAREPTDDDRQTIRGLLALDRHISGELRERMLRIREEAMATQFNQTALAGYRSDLRAAHSLDAEG